MVDHDQTPIKPRTAILRFAAPIVALLAFGMTSEARAQVAPGGVYGGYGWGGWGGETVPGSAFRGMGIFAQGLGAGDLQSAQADAIRTQSFMELNEYLYRSSLMQRQRAAAAREASQERVAEARDALQGRRASEPTPLDVESGDTLNNILFEIDNPGIPDSVVRDAAEGMTIPGSSVEKIPFMFAHRGTAISLRRLTSEGEGWPTVLRADELAPLRDRYEEIIDQILDVSEGESVPTELVEEARSTLREMYQAVQNAQNLPGPTVAEGLRHLKALAGMVTMLEQPDVKKVIDEAASVEDVALPTLLSFMRFYNLQFGAADTQEEKAVYSQELYPKMAQLRDSLMEQYDGQLPGSVASDDQEATRSPTGAFDDFDWEQLGISREQQPAPSDQPQQEGTLDPSP